MRKQKVGKYLTCQSVRSVPSSCFSALVRIYFRAAYVEVFTVLCCVRMGFLVNVLVLCSYFVSLFCIVLSSYCFVLGWVCSVFCVVLELLLYIVFVFLLLFCFGLRWYCIMCTFISVLCCSYRVVCIGLSAYVFFVSLIWLPYAMLYFQSYRVLMCHIYHAFMFNKITGQFWSYRGH